MTEAMSARSTGLYDTYTKRNVQIMKYAFMHAVSLNRAVIMTQLILLA